MFTDMVGYTTLIQADESLGLDKRERYWSALEAGHAACGGTIVQRLGDGSMSMFPSALGAVEAAVSIQRKLTSAEVPARIGIHVGEVIVEPERLSGEAVNIASRIESFSVAGGVMLSDSAYDQIKSRAELDVVAVGRYRLKNVGRPYELYAISAEGLVVPDPQTLAGKGENASLPTNLPEPGAQLIGRGSDLAALVQLVRENRLVTITGPGGTGKTRLLVELGKTITPEFLDGVSFAALADVTDPGGFVPALAEALDVKEAEGRTLGEGIVTLIGDREALLLLDNFEQIVSAAPEVAQMIERCPRLRVVATSRTPLRIAAEHQYPLAPLDIESAVALFLERAGAFRLTPENAEAVTAICRRLDGLPLALELAAARMRLLPPDELLERLDRALDVLTAGARDAPERQRTLRATIDWSHSQLNDGEQRLFRLLAVFVGGFTVRDVELTCGEPDESVLDELESLVDKALVQTDGQGGRLLLLQTIHEYARERLRAAGEARELSRRHAQRYAQLARELRDGIEGTDQIASLQRGAADEANIEAALDTLLEAAGAGEAAAVEEGLQLCGDLWMYWHMRGKNLTQRRYVLAFLGFEGGATLARAGALLSAGIASWVFGQFEQANREWGEAYRLASELDSGRELCLAAMSSGLGWLPFDVPKGLALMAECIELSRRVGFTWAEGFGLTCDGILRTAAGDTDGAQRCFSAGLEIERSLGDEQGAGLSLGGLAQLAAARGDLDEALDLYRQSCVAFQVNGDRAEEARILSEMASTHLRRGDSTLARRAFFESAQAYEDIASVRGVGLSLIGLAAANASEGRHIEALQIAAAAEVYAQQDGIVNVYTEQPVGRDLIDAARSELSPEDATRATEAGRLLGISEALDLARGPAHGPGRAAVDG
jgi:predicted ATPase